MILGAEWSRGSNLGVGGRQGLPGDGVGRGILTFVGFVSGSSGIGVAGGAGPGADIVCESLFMFCLHSLAMVGRPIHSRTANTATVLSISQPAPIYREYEKNISRKFIYILLILKCKLP